MDGTAVTQDVWKIFVPHDLINQSDSCLFGHVTCSNQSVCITASSSRTCFLIEGIPGLELIGRWSKTGKGHKKQDDETKHSVWIVLWCSDHFQIKCRARINGVDIQCTCVLYDPLELLHSTVISDRCWPHNGPAETVSDDNITSLTASLYRSRSVFQTVDRNLLTEVTQYCGQVKQGRHWLQTAVEQALTIFIRIYLLFHYLFSICSSSKWFHAPTFISQLQSRTADLHHVKFDSSMKPIQRVRHLNRCCRQVLDTALGVCLMLYLMQGTRASQLASAYLRRADIVAADLRDLLHWLMGAPAGLKLNSQLTHFLGNFFLYHVHLWTGFLYLTQSILGDLVYYCSISGVFGVTVQLALFQDIFSVLTVHVYCFYVYAARLYKLQIYALGSLWRLFRGKKWNVLRQRVDSAEYDADQLFLGTLLFTILLFLLPTTGLYYVVFALLRLLILVIQSFMGKLRQWSNSLQVWSLCLWLGRASTFTEGAVFQVIEGQGSNECLLIRMKVTRLGLSAVLRLGADEDHGTGSEEEASYSLGQVARKLIRGDLIYPWLEKG